mgnify:CR=1 FL=1
MAAKAADGSFFDGDQSFVIACKVQDQIAVQWFGKARVGHGECDTSGRQCLGRFQNLGQTRPEGQDRNTAAFAHDTTTTDLQWDTPDRHFDPDPFTARIAKGNRASVMRRRSRDHMHQFRLVCRSHDDNSGQIGQKRHIKCAGMGRAVGTDQNKKYVLVVGEGDKTEYRAVTLGAPVDGLRTVLSGLKPGERIVVNGLQRVRPGDVVQPQVVPMNARAETAAVARS